jgi:hypothetical protein
MEVRLTPDLEQQLTAAAAKSGRPVDELAEEAIAGYLSDLIPVRSLLDSHYDDVKWGKVTLVPGEEVEAYFREKSAAARRL